MSDVRSTNCRVGFRSAETWLIVAVLFFAGIAIGFPLGMLAEGRTSEQRISSIRTAYGEALAAKDESIRMCIATATEAANKAKKAAEGCSSFSESAP